MNPPLSIADLEQFTLQNFSAKPCICDDKTTLSFQEFWKAVDSKRTEFIFPKPKAPITLFPKNSISSLIEIFGIWKAGGVVVPLNLKFSSNQKAEILEKIYPCRIPGDPETKYKKSKNPVSLPNEVDVLIATSGSAGSPKLVALSIENFLWSASGSSLNISLHPSDCWLISLPLFHVGGLSIIFRTMLAGASALISPKLPNIDFMNLKQITHLSMVPTQLERLLNSETQFGNALKAILLGGSKISQALIRKSLKMNLPIYTSYGCSEMASQVCTTSQEATFEELITSGRVLNNRQVKISQDGRIQLNGKTRFQGYWQHHKLIKPFDEGGWFTSNDLGKFDKSGFLNVKGRVDRMFVSGGENIHPEQIEHALKNLDGITNAFVIDMPSKTYGSRPVAFLQRLKRSSYLELKKQLSKNLTAYQIPDVFLDWPSDEISLKPNLDQFRKIALKKISLCN